MNMHSHGNFLQFREVCNLRAPPFRQNSATLPDRALRLAEQMGLRDTGALPGTQKFKQGGHIQIRVFLGLWT